MGNSHSRSGVFTPRDPVALYDRISARSSAHIMEASRKARDVAPAPEIRDRAVREAATASLRYFLEVCFPRTFPLAWSADHLRVIARLESVICDGGQYAIAMPRGQGKTVMTVRAAMWAILTGRRRFVVIAAATERLAEQALAAVKSELEHNEALLASWPKIVHPIRRLESQSRRCVGQLYQGARTQITWQRKQIVLPTVPGPDAEASGGVLHVAGLGAAIRGLSHVDAEGRTFRPDLVLVDDPQDRESAKSVVQTSERVAILNGDLLGLAGPDRRIASMATVTVILRNDLADQLLDPERSPAWESDRCKLVYRWPDNTELWDEYLSLRKEGSRPGGDRGAAANELYRQNREAMDLGAEVSWPARYLPGELSAIQHAFNLKSDRGEAVFQAEYQNEPVESSLESSALDPGAIAARVGNLERWTAPAEAEKLVGFVDIGGSLLWYLIAAFDENFGCTVVDYGCWPEQRTRMFMSRNASPALDQKYPQAGGGEGAIYAGLKDLIDRLMARDWMRTDGASLPLSRLMIDAGWSTEVVRLHIRQSPHRDRLVPSKGVGISAHQTQINDYHKRPGEKLGDGWILGLAGPDRLRLLRFDSNFWKSRVAGMLTRPMGARGGVTLYGSRPVDHELLAAHLTAEFPTRVEAKGTAVDVWQRRPDAENHLLDALVGACVCASFEGLSPMASLGAKSTTAKRQRVSFAEMQRRRRDRRPSRG